VQPELKYIINPSTRSRAIQFNDTNKDYCTDNFRTTKFRSNHEQSIHPIEQTKNSDNYLSEMDHCLSFGVQSVNNDNNFVCGYTRESMTR